MLRTLLTIFALIYLAGYAIGEPVWIGVNEHNPTQMEVLRQTEDFAVIEFECGGLYLNRDDDGGLLYSLDGVKSGDIPSFTRLLALPAFRDVELEIIYAEYAEIECAEDVAFESRLFEVGGPVILRDLRAAPVTVYPLRPGRQAGKAQLLTRAEVRVNFKGDSFVNNKDYTGATSAGFANIYRSSVMNYDLLDNGSSNPLKGTYLIIAPQSYTTVSQFDSFILWKTMKGYTVETHILTSQVTNPDIIKNVIIGVYQNADPPLEYVMLIGDVNGGSITIPSYITSGSAQNVTDHPYSLLEGDDYFSDIFIGRVSVSNTNEVQVVLNKVLRYEKTPFVGMTQWYREMLSVAGNWVDSGPIPITPVQTGWWIADYFRSHGYTFADTIFFWDFGLSPYPGTDLILSSINAGKGVVTYRGWSDAHGWQFPVFNISSIEQLRNGWMLPVILSFVCNTGDFGNSINPCFGEKFIRFGTISSGGAAVAFFGPSDLYTNTNYNNAISSGFVEGFIGEDINHMAQAAAYSKMTLYEAFPRDRGRGDRVEFYFNVYNVLGDPELEIWKSVPQNMTLDCAATLPAGASNLSVHLTRNGNPVRGAYVTAVQSGTLLDGRCTEGEGSVTLTFPPLSAGELTVTATKYGYAPEISTISVNSTEYIGYSSHTLENESNPDGVLNPGETADVRVVVKNYGASAQNNVSGVLSTNNPYLTINSASHNFGGIGSGSTSSGDYSVSVDSQAPAMSAVDFTLDITASGGNYQSKFSEALGGSEIAVEDVSHGVLNPGYGGAVTVSLVNNGAFTASNVGLSLDSFDEAVIITSGSANVGDIPAGGTVNTGGQLAVEIAPNAYEGRMIQMRLQVSPQTGAEQTLYFDIVVGSPDSTDPTGPDPYGYFAYDDGDAGYSSVPVYDWVELDPNYPGAVTGAVPIFMEDDSSTRVALPFDFVFYGETYDSVTICTNGWVSFTETWMADFRNWDLPSPLGPPALIAAFWDDLKDIYDDTLDIYHWYDSANHRFIVEWSRVQNRFSGVPNREETLELILYDPQYRHGPTGDGDILIQFKVVNDIDETNNYCTVGVEDYHHQRGLEYVYGNVYPPTSATLHNEMAVLITTTPPDNYSGAADAPASVPSRFKLSQNFPNPFNPQTMVSFEIAEKGFTELKVYDINGRLTRALVSGELDPGQYHQTWDGRDESGEAVSSGIYIFRLISGEHRRSVKGVLLK